MHVLMARLQTNALLATLPQVAAPAAWVRGRERDEIEYLFCYYSCIS